MTVAELNVGDSVNGLELLLEKASVALTKGGKSYLRFTARDKKGSIDGVFWNYNPLAEIKEGDVVAITGRIDTYNGAKQLNPEHMAKTGKTADDFARWTHMDVEKIWGDLVGVVNSFTEPMTKFIAEELLLKQAAMVEAFKRAPAAKSVHNNWYGGLLEHVWSLCQMAEFVVKHYQTHYVDQISRDKVMFGLMFHDAGKVVEYDYRTASFSFTTVGTFTNHMVLGPAWVYETANKWWAENKLELAVHMEGAVEWTTSKFKIERAHLMHVLAAHHGQIEWGSPMKPASMEAILVHHLDNLDAKMLHAFDFVKNKPGNIEGFSEYSKIEGTGFYNYKV